MSAVNATAQSDRTAVQFRMHTGIAIDCRGSLLLSVAGAGER